MPSPLRSAPTDEDQALLAGQSEDFVQRAGPAAAKMVLEYLSDAASSMRSAEIEVLHCFNIALQRALERYYESSAATAEQPASAAHPPFLENALRLAARGSVNAALDVIYDAIDSLMCDGKVEDLRGLVTSVSPADVPVDLCIGVLSASIPMRDRLPERKGLYDRIAAALREQGENPDEALLGLD